MKYRFLSIAVAVLVVVAVFAVGGCVDAMQNASTDFNHPQSWDELQKGIEENRQKMIDSGNIRE